MNTRKANKGKAGLAVLAILALCVATATFGQSSNANNGRALGQGKLEPALEVLEGLNIDPGATAAVIVQFLEDEGIAGGSMTKGELKQALKEARKQAIVDAGGQPGRDFENFPMHTLKRLEKHPYVTRISIDHEINGSTYTTARAVGADQVWAGSWYVPGYDGTGIGGTRADKAFEAIVDFTSFRKGDAFGLTIFGTEVVHWVPLTKDLTALRLAAPFLRPEKMPPHMGGTRIAHALEAVQKILRSREEGDRMVVLISDGMSFDLNGGVAQKLGEDLRADDITVFYIHTAEGSPQEETYTVANLTGGQAFSAGDPESLREVFKSIDAMKPAKLKPSTPQPADWFWPFALAGLSVLGLKVLSLLGLRFTPW